MAKTFKIYVELPRYDTRDAICGSYVSPFGGMDYENSALPLKLADRLNAESGDFGSDESYFVASCDARGFLVREVPARPALSDFPM